MHVCCNIQPLYGVFSSHFFCLHHCLCTIISFIHCVITFCCAVVKVMSLFYTILGPILMSNGSCSCVDGAHERDHSFYLTFFPWLTIFIWPFEKSRQHDIALGVEKWFILKKTVTNPFARNVIISASPLYFFFSRAASLLSSVSYSIHLVLGALLFPIKLYLDDFLFVVIFLFAK